MHHAPRRILGAVVASLALAATGVTVAPAAAAAQPVCATASLTSYLQLGSDGCTFDGVRFTDFGVGRITIGGGADGILLTPTAGASPYAFGTRYGTGFTLTFSPAFARTIIGQDATGAAVQDFTFTAIGSEATALRGIGLGLAATASPGFTRSNSSFDVREAFAFLFGSSDVGPLFAAVCRGIDCQGNRDTEVHIGPVSSLPGSMRLELDVQLNVGSGLSPRPDEVSSVEISSVRASVLTRTPEPGTWALLGAGLLGVGGVAVRRRRVLP